jgi:hypothetical protein
VNTLFSLLPGLRELRAPLIGGYLWLSAAWLVWGQSVPTSGTDSTYSRLWELINALGPVGDAAAVSVVAYLLGSLVQSVVLAVRSWAINSSFAIRGRFQGLVKVTSGARQAPLRAGEFEPLPRLAELVEGWNEYSGERGFSSFILPAHGLEATWFYTRTKMLEEATRALSNSIRRQDSEPRAQFRYERQGDRDVVEIPDGEGRLSRFVVPRLPRSFSIREVVVPSVSQAQWNRMSSLQAEAGFREAIAFPLIALIVIFATQVGLPWLAALVVPLALLVQRLTFLRQYHWIALSVLQSAGPDELGLLTPQFASCIADATALSDAIEGAKWNEGPSKAGPLPDPPSAESYRRHA